MKTTRRNFLKFLGVGAATAAVPKIAEAEPEPEVAIPAEPEPRVAIPAEPEPRVDFVSYATAVSPETMTTEVFVKGQWVPFDPRDYRPEERMRPVGRFPNSWWTVRR